MIIQNSLKPVRYEGAGVCACAGTFAERHFPGSQRANNSEPGLQDNNTDCCQVCDSKAWISHPCPVTQLPDKNQYQAKDHERNEQYVTEKKGIRGQ